jgi:hypothetical protein
MQGVDLGGSFVTSQHWTVWYVILKYIAKEGRFSRTRAADDKNHLLTLSWWPELLE